MADCNPLGPVANYDVNASLVAIRDNLIQELQNETAYRLANGPKPTYQIADRHVDWNEYLQGMMDDIRKMEEMIIAMNPYEILTRGWC